jgi:putative nucleotidyltransferase with HDIG domain
MKDHKQTQKISSPLYNSRIVKAYLQLVRKKYPYIHIPDLLANSGITPYEADDQGHWFDHERLDRFYEQLVRATGDDQLARDAGRYAAFSEPIGTMACHVYGFTKPTRFYEMLEQAYSSLFRTVHCQVRQVNARKIEVTVTARHGVCEKIHHCENRKGFFEAVLNVFNNRVIHIEHPQCMARGDSTCRYVISWNRSARDCFSTIGKHSFTVVSITGILSLVMMPAVYGLSVFAGVMVLMTATIFLSRRLDQKNFTAAMQNLQESSEQLVDQIDINYNNTQVTQEIGRVVNRSTGLEKSLAAIVQILESRLDYDRGMIMLCNEGKTRLRFAAGFGYPGRQSRFLENVEFEIDGPDSWGVFALSFREQKAYMVNDLNDIEGSLSARSLQFAMQMGAVSFICCPVMCDKESLGVLVVDNVRSKRLLRNSDMSLLVGVSHMIGISIRHAQHIEAGKQQLRSVLQVMVSSIDARDPVTKEHSECVAEYAAGICREMGIDEEYQEAVKVAALLHDYGKIGIPDDLLKKKDELTPREYECIKSHAEKTFEILKQMNFEKNLQQVPEMAGAHHEKIDGTGYPRGLKKDEIPLGARIISVADYFEALTASRHYSQSMAPEQALRQLEAHTGTFFDPRVVKTFISYYQRKNPGYKNKVVRKNGRITLVVQKT